MTNKLKKIYAAFDPAPLTAGQTNLYIDLNAVRGDAGIVRHLQRKIELSNSPTCQVLTGHRGSGKSTELWRLQHDLQEANADRKRYFVVVVQADEHMDRNDVDFPEVLIAIIRQLAADLKTRLKITLKPGYFKDRWDRLKKLLGSEISFDGLDLSAGMAELSTIIKNSPDARLEIRKLLDPDTNNWLTAANDVIGKAKQELQAKGYHDFVVIVDDLDKMVTRSHDSAECTTTEYLFVHRAAQLTAFQCHVVYTMPLELAYSHHEQTIEDRYGGAVPVVPMTKIATPPPKSKAYKQGIDRFRDIIKARLDAVGATHDELFDSKGVETDLIKLSGGQPTELMTLIRESIISHDLPIKSIALRRCHEESLRGYRRQLRPDHWPILEEARRTGQVTRTQKNERGFRELIESRALLLYRNDEEWYALHPVVADIEPPKLVAPVADQSTGE